MHVMYGKYSPFFNAHLDRILTPSIWKVLGKKYFTYYHHAIVSEIHWTSDTVAKVSLVEFIPVGLLECSITETTKEIDLEEEKNIFYRKYTGNKYEDDEIVARARSRLGDKNYHPLTNNCESLAVWSVSGEHESFQATEFTDDKLRLTMPYVAELVKKITTFIRKWNVVDLLDMTDAFGDVTSNIFGIVVVGFVFLLEAIICFIRLKQLHEQEKSGLICDKCNKTKVVKLIFKMLACFAAICLMTIAYPCSGHILCPAGIAIRAVAVTVVPNMAGCMYRMFRKGVSFINPSYNIPKIIVNNDIFYVVQPGDILTIPKNHDIIVKSVECISRDNQTPCKWIQLEIVYFAYRWVPSIITGTKTAWKDKFCLNFGKNLKVIPFPESEVYENTEVVQRALRLFGRTDCDDVLRAILSCKISSSEYLETELKKRQVQPAIVTDQSEVSVGDVVVFRYFRLHYTGIVVNKGNPPGIFKLAYYHLGKSKLVQVHAEIFDLQNVQLYLHSGQNKFTRPEILHRAEKAVGTTYKINILKPYKSNRFVMEITSYSDSVASLVVKSCNTLRPGMLLRYGNSYPFERSHKRNVSIETFFGGKDKFTKDKLSIITKVHSTTDDTAEVSLVECTVEKNNETMIEEKIRNIDLKTETVFAETYPDESTCEKQIIDYARSLINNNTQPDKGLDKTEVEDSSNLFSSWIEILLGVKLKNGSKRRIKRSTDIQKGDIFIICKNDMIVVKSSKKCTETEKITEIKLHIVHFAWVSWFDRKVQEEVKTFTLPKDNLQVLEYPEDQILPVDMVVSNARSVIGENKFSTFNNRSSHMCRRCKLKPKYYIKNQDYKIRKVQTSSDVNIGDMVNFFYYWLPHKGLVVGKDVKNDADGDVIELEYYQFSRKDNTIHLKTSIFDLSTDEIYSHHHLDGSIRSHLLKSADEIKGKRVIY